MNECKFQFSEMQHHNDDELVKSSRIGKTEKARLSLQYVRNVHRIKSDTLGYCYRAIGDIAWQLLSEIHLHNIDRVKINQAAIEQSMDLTDEIAKRYLEILQTEMLLEETPQNRDKFQDLQLTDFGQSKVQSIIEECAETFTSIFIYSELSAVETD